MQEDFNSPVNPYQAPRACIQEKGGLYDPALLVPGGFWRRLAAYCVDSVLLGVTTTIWGMIGGLANLPQWSVSGVGVVAYMAYYAGFESSRWQATLGKQWIGLRVVSEQGARLSGSWALLRYIAAGLNWVLLGLPYLMVAYTSRKQGIHDVICKSLVVLENPREGSIPTRVWVILGIAGAFWVMIMMMVALIVVWALSYRGLH